MKTLLCKQQGVNEWFLSSTGLFSVKYYQFLLQLAVDGNIFDTSIVNIEPFVGYIHQLLRSGGTH